VSLRLDGDRIYRSALLDDLRWLRHGFGTRHATPEPRAVTLRQIHSTKVILAQECGPATEGDALITDNPGVFVAVKTADCLPILIADPEKRVVAAVHAGWRGTVAGVAAETVAEMAGRFGCRPENLRAAFGPSIRGCCYEVGPEVAAQFALLFPEREDLEGRAHVDLAEANRRILGAAGLKLEHLDVEAPCTRCYPAEFHSWRRDGEAAGRMFSGVGILGPEDTKRAWELAHAL
jgi:YfiH family protein